MFVRSEFGTTPAVVIAILLLALLPAATAVLAVERAWLPALSPVALLTLIRTLGGWYVAIVLWSIFAVVVTTSALAADAGFLALVLAQLLMFSIFTLIGGAVYERRLELGFDAWESPERSAERQRQADDRARARTAEELYTLVRTNQVDAATTLKNRWLEAEIYSPEAYRWLRDQAAKWPDRRFADALTRDLVSRLLTLERTGDAVLEVERWWKSRGSFTPASAAELLRLYRIARDIGHDATAERLQSMGPAQFPEAPELATLRQPQRPQ
jgi:hypothetical protein